MHSVDTMPKLPYPAFDIARYAPLAAKISKENDFLAEVVDTDKHAQDTPSLPASPMNLSELSLTERNDRLEALDAAEEYLNFAQDLNDTFKRTLDMYL